MRTTTSSGLQGRWGAANGRGRLRGVVAVLTGALLLTGLPATAGTAADEGGSTETGSISGVVTTADGTPVADVTVTLSASEGGYQYRWARTAADGTYRLTGVTPTRYTVVATSSSDSQTWLRATHPATVPVTAGQEVTGIDIVVEQGGRVEGTATCPSRPSVQGRAMIVDESGLVEDSAYLGTDGRYSLLVPAGSYVVAFQIPGCAMEYYDDVNTLAAATSVNVAAGQVVTGIDAVLSEGASLTGRVTDTTGAPAAGVAVSANGFETRTGDDGRYTLAGMVPGATTWVTVSDPDELRFVQQVSSLDVAVTPTLDVRLERGGVISGHVTDSTGTALPAVISTDGDHNRTTLVWKAGVYSLVVPPGTHRVGFHYSGLLSTYYDDASTLDGATPVTVGVGQAVTGIDAVLTRGGAVKGTVRDAKGVPVPGFTVKVGEIKQNGSATYGLHETVTATDGTFLVRALRPGTRYRVLVQDPQLRHLDSSVDFVATEGEVTLPGVRMTLAGTITGTITGPTGEPVVGAGILVRSGSAEVFTTTDRYGAYVAAKIPPGTTRITVTPNTPSNSRYAAQVYDWEPNGWAPFGVGGAGKPVNVTAGSVTRIDMQLWHSDLSNVFTDVPASHPFVREIAWMKANGISTGNANGTYGPTASVTREALAAFLYRMAGRPTYTPPKVSPFRDVAVTHPFYKEICWLAASTITTGWPDGTFRPGLAVERQAMAAFLYRFAGKPAFTPPATSPFRDVRTTDPFYKEIAWLASVGVAGGYTDGGYRPTAAVDRQAMAAFLNRLDRKVLP